MDKRQGVKADPTETAIVTTDSGAKTADHDYDLTQIPLLAEIRIGRIFKQGERIYGRNNWRKGLDRDFQIKRANKALKHLKMYIHHLEFGAPHPLHMEGEDDLAKVGWFCVTQMELEGIGQSDEKGKNE